MGILTYFLPPGNTVGSLPSSQHAVLVGSLLGDGTLRRQGTRTNALFEANHSFRSRAYVDWKYRQLRMYVLTPPRRRKGNGKRVAYRFTTRSLPVFTQYHAWFYRNGRKRVPRNLQLSPLILAVWFMDDGAKSRSAVYLNTQQFPKRDQETLQQFLRKSFGIQSTLNRDKNYWRLRLSVHGTQRLKRFVHPFIVPCMRYKLR